MNAFVRFVVMAVRTVVVAFLARQALRAMAQGGPATRGTSGPPVPDGGPRNLGRMVRDPVCGVYLPEAQAVRVVEGGQTLFFCSEACRKKHAGVE